MSDNPNTSPQAITPPELEAYYGEWKMSPGVKAHGLVFLTGMTGHQPDGSISDDAETQFRAAFANVAIVLKEAGLTMADIVEMTSYHVDVQKDIASFRQVREEFVHEPYPAWTAIGVAGLINPKAIVELRVVAASRIE